MFRVYVTEFVCLTYFFDFGRVRLSGIIENVAAEGNGGYNDTVRNCQGESLSGIDTV